MPSTQSQGPRKDLYEVIIDATQSGEGVAEWDDLTWPGELMDSSVVDGHRPNTKHLVFLFSLTSDEFGELGHPRMYSDPISPQANALYFLCRDIVADATEGFAYVTGGSVALQVFPDARVGI